MLWPWPMGHRFGDLLPCLRQCHDQTQPTGFHSSVLIENHAGVSIECYEYWPWDRMLLQIMFYDFRDMSNWCVCNWHTSIFVLSWILEYKYNIGPMWPWYLNVRDRQTDGRTNTRSNTALCVASRGKKVTRSQAVARIAARTAKNCKAHVT